MEQYNNASGPEWFNMNCTDFTIGAWKSLNLLRGILTMLGAIIILAILSFLIYFKAYRSLLQRLYLYLIIATLLSEITGILSIEHQWQYKGQETVCVWIGLLTVWTYVQLFFFSYEIIFYLLYLVVSKLMRIQLTKCGVGCTKCCAVIFETMYALFPALVSTAFALPPYLQGKYGIAGPWCFLRSLNSSCEPTGKMAQMTFYSTYMSLGMAGIIATFVFLIVYFKLANSFKDVRHLLKRTLYVLAFKFVHILMIMCSMGCRIYTLETRRHQSFGLWLTHAFAFPLGVLVFPLGYFFCFHPVGKIAKIIYKKIAWKYCKHSVTFNSVEALSVTAIMETAPASNRISQPSYTYFSVQHSEVESEKTPLISDAGYSSTNSTYDFCK